MSRPTPWGRIHPADCRCVDCRTARRPARGSTWLVIAIFLLPLIVLVALALAGRIFGGRP